MSNNERGHEDKEYVNLNNIEKMYQHYLLRRKEMLQRQKIEIKDAFVLSLMDTENIKNEDLDDEWEKNSINPLSFEDFKTALIYRLTLVVEGALEYLDPYNNGDQNYLIEDMIDETFNFG